jgi:hypothetical protein
MKKILLFACAALVALASCSKDPGDASPAVSGEKVFVLGVEEYTPFSDDSRAYNMGLGGLNNINRELYSMRYVLEIYTEADEAFVGRYERFSDLGEVGEVLTGVGTQFKVNLDMNEYRFVMWADFVPKTEASGDALDEQVAAADAQDNYYNTKSGLRNVAIDMVKYSDSDSYPVEVIDVEGGTPITQGGRMLRDAYCGSKVISLFEEDTDVIQLRRPFTRVELRSSYQFRTDQLDEGVLVVPSSITMEYTDGFYTAYDVYAQDVIAASSQTAPVSFNAAPAEDVIITEVTISNLPGKRYQQLVAFDYVFAPAVQEQLPEDPEEDMIYIYGKISFSGTVFDGNGDEILVPNLNENVEIYPDRHQNEQIDQDLRVNRRFVVTGIYLGGVPEPEPDPVPVP